MFKTTKQLPGVEIDDSTIVNGKKEIRFWLTENPFSDKDGKIAFEIYHQIL
jgi:hypothetical protein